MEQHPWNLDPPPSIPGRIPPKDGTLMGAPQSCCLTAKSGVAQFSPLGRLRTSVDVSQAVRTTEVSNVNNDRRVTALREKVLELAAAVADPTQTDQVFQNYMTWISQLHQRYSFANTALILSAIPTATHVAGYRRWQSMGYQVKYGQRGLPILVPIHGTKVERVDPLTDEPITYQPIRGFAVGHVWDISQCEGPSPPDYKHRLSDDVRPLLDASVALAEEQGIEVEFRTLMGSVSGLSKGGEIVINSARPVGVQAQVVLHEWAHETLHPRESRVEANRALHEGEAEATAWAVLQHFGVEGTMNNAAEYIRSHQAQSTDQTRSILGSLERITGAAHDLIQGLERHLSPDLCQRFPVGG